MTRKEKAKLLLNQYLTLKMATDQCLVEMIKHYTEAKEAYAIDLYCMFKEADKLDSFVNVYIEKFNI